MTYNYRNEIELYAIWNLVCNLRRDNGNGRIGGKTSKGNDKRGERSSWLREIPFDLDAFRGARMHKAGGCTERRCASPTCGWMQFRHGGGGRKNSAHLTFTPQLFCPRSRFIFHYFIFVSVETACGLMRLPTRATSASRARERASCVLCVHTRTRALRGAGRVWITR